MPRRNTETVSDLIFSKRCTEKRLKLLWQNVSPILKTSVNPPAASLMTEGYARKIIFPLSSRISTFVNVLKKLSDPATKKPTRSPAHTARSGLRHSASTPTRPQRLTGRCARFTKKSFRRLRKNISVSRRLRSQSSLCARPRSFRCFLLSSRNTGDVMPKKKSFEGYLSSLISKGLHIPFL